jgi:hypothetical protein
MSTLNLLMPSMTNALQILCASSSMDDLLSMNNEKLRAIAMHQGEVFAVVLEGDNPLESSDNRML